jgi:tetratricopeptide (TPR) repeat protein
VVAGDHGEALGEHGELFHGNLLYQGVVRVPLVLAGDGIEPAVRGEPVSIRRVFDTILGWAGLGGERTLLVELDEPVLGEAMQPYLLYGWQPQAMAVSESLKAIRAGAVELYDLGADPGETRDLAGALDLPRPLREALRDYPVPSKTPAAAAANALDDEARAKLASLGYVTSGAPPRLRPDAPRPAAMTHLFAALDRVSGSFARGDYAAAIPVLEEILAADPGNLSVALRLAAGHSALGRDARAVEYFERAEAIDPESLDLAHYRALHELQSGDWRRAAPRLERVLAAMPERLPALGALAEIRRRQERIPEAIALLERAVALEREPLPKLLEIGELAMSIGDTPTALRAYERVRELEGAEFGHHLELGVLYLAERRLAEAAAALDRVSPAHPEYPLALFKRAQVAVLLDEPDAAERIADARELATPVTRRLIEREHLFAGR